MKIQFAAVLCLALTSVSAATADSIFPIRKGTEWVYKFGDLTQSSRVEKITNVETQQGDLSAAVVRRNDGTDRLMFRTDQDWYECEGTKMCALPLLVVKAPLQAGARWTSRQFEFVVEQSEAVQTPFKNFETAWKISYAAEGSPDIVGDVWFVPNIGIVRILEGDRDFQLVEYKSGSGSELPVSQGRVADAFVRGAAEESKRSPNMFFSWFGTVAALTRSKLFPLFLLQGLVLFALIAVGVALWKMMGQQKKEIELVQASNEREESKWMATLLHSEDLASARTRLEKLVSENPNYADLRYHLAVTQELVGNVDEAVKNLEAAIVLNPKYMQARLRLAQLKLGLGEPNAALEHFKVVTEQHPEYADAQFGLGKTLVLLERKAEARKPLEAAIHRNPSLKEARDLLAQC